jgi:hypothetical protein
MQIRDRIRELRRVPASQLRPSPRNWRTHPKSQQDALRGVLAEIGYADALLARELPDASLELIDGHLRAETTPDSIVPVLILDVTQEEADKILATLDPLAALAEADKGKLDALLREVQTGSEALIALLTGLAERAGVMPEVKSTDDWPELGPTTTHTITLRYTSGDEAAIKDFVGHEGDGPLDPIHTGQHILERIKDAAARRAD